MHSPLTKLETARLMIAEKCQELAEATSIREAKDIHQWARMVKAAAKERGDCQEIVELAAELQARSEIRLGQFLLAMPKNKGGGDRRSNHRSSGTTGDNPTLKEMRLTKTQSSRFQNLARLSKKEQETYVTDVKKRQQKGITAAQRNASRDKHYWLTPPDLMAELQLEFDFDFDPCPHPRPKGFDGLKEEWRRSNDVNPIFGNGNGPTAWAHKTIEEHKKGNTVVMVWPMDRWVLDLIEAGAELRNLGNVKWCAVEDGTPGSGSGRYTAAFILRESNGK